jgi:hypothetical protein
MFKKARKRSPSKKQHDTKRKLRPNLLDHQLKGFLEGARSAQTQQHFRSTHDVAKPISLDDDLRAGVLSNAPPVLVSLYVNMRLSARVAQSDGVSPPRTLPLLERLLKDIRMEPVWQTFKHQVRMQSVNQQEAAYRGIWSAIHYAWARYKSPVIPRSELKNAIFRIGRGLQRVGEAIAPYFPDPKEKKKKRKVWGGVPSWLLWECLPDELAEVLDHWAPHMGLVAMKANETARTVLANKRPVDRSGYDYSVFMRLFQEKCPQFLKSSLTDDVLAQIACAAFPDLMLTAQEVRDTLRRTLPRQSH